MMRKNQIVDYDLVRFLVKTEPNRSVPTLSPTSHLHSSGPGFGPNEWRLHSLCLSADLGLSS